MAPASVAAVPGNARVTIGWAPVSGAAGYRIFRTTTGVWETNPVATVSSTKLTNTNLQNGTKYWYRVAAYNKKGTGPRSVEVGATPLAPPTGLAAVAGDQQVSLAWLASPGASSYNVLRKGPNETVYTSRASGVTGVSFVDTGLTNGSWYYYKLTAVVDGSLARCRRVCRRSPCRRHRRSRPFSPRRPAAHECN